MRGLLLAVVAVAAIDHVRLSSLLAEHARRNSTERADTVRVKAERIRGYMFEAQRACTQDPSRLVAARCTRRSGKSSGWLREMTATAIEIPNSRQVYISTTRPEAEAIAWVGSGRDGLLSLNQDYDCGGVPNMAKLRMTFQNGATIDLVGADDLRTINRLRGRAFHRVVIEEAQKAPHLEYTVREVLQPALADYGGQVALIGTPSKECIGLFYEVTRDDRDEGRYGQWSAHHWSVLANPRFGASEAERYERTIVQVLRQNHWTGDEPEFRREWLGQWVREDAYYVYEVHRVPEHELYWDAPAMPPLEGPHVIPRRDEMMRFLPRGDGNVPLEWVAVIGIDLGYMDPFAYHLWLFSHDDPCLYEVASWKRSGLSFDEQGVIMRVLADEWSPICMPTDAGGHAVKSAIKGWREGWQERKPLPVVEAHKTDKQTAIGWYNADLRARKLRYRRGSLTLAEQRRLQWRVDVGGQILGENKATENHCSDASLYAHRHARHYLHEAPAAKPKHGTPEWMDAEAKRLRQEAIEAVEGEGAGGYGRWL